EHGRTRETAHDLAGRLLEHVRTDAGQRIVDGAAVAPVVRGCQEVDAGVICQDAHPRVTRQRLDECALDRAAGCVRGVHDARDRVPGPAAEGEIAAGFEIGRYLQSSEQ